MGSFEQREAPRKFLVVGMGSIGRRHFRVLRDMYPAAAFGIVSRRPDAGENVYPSIERVPDIGSFDYFVICSETALHEEHFLKIESAVKGKTVLVEKPLFSAFRDFPPPVNTVYVGYNLRFHPALSMLRARLLTRRILSIRIMTGQYLPTWRPGTDYRGSYSASKERGGGVLRDLSHELDYLQWMAGSLKELHGISRKLSPLHISSDDIMCFVGVTEGGSIAHVYVDYLSRRPTRTIVAQCDDATYVCDLINGTLEEFLDNERTILARDAIGERDASYREMHRDILEHGGRVACSFSEGQRVMRTIRMIEDSDAKDWMHE
jgi:predicted dehydrogenase